MNDTIAQLIADIRSKNFKKDTLELNGADLSDDEFRLISAELSNDDECRNKIKKLYLGFNKFKVLDLSCFSGVLSNVYLYGNPDLAIVILHPKVVIDVLQLLGPNINLTTKIAVKSANARSKYLNPKIRISTSVYDKDLGFVCIQDLKLPLLSPKILHGYFSFIFAEYVDVLDLNRKLYLLNISVKDKMKVDLLDQVCSCLERASDLLNLLYNSVRMFVSAFPLGTVNGHVLTTFLTSNNLTLEILEEAKNSGKAKRAQIDLLPEPVEAIYEELEEDLSKDTKICAERLRVF